MTADTTLAPCPWCGGGETQIHVNKGTWTGMGYGEPVSAEVRHWCTQEAGQPSRMISRAGRDEASAITAWNRRAQAPAPQGPALVPLTGKVVGAIADAAGFCSPVEERAAFMSGLRHGEAAHGITGAPNGSPE
ncbi:MAG: hypothetical protein EOO31_09825 [Comamonadaceae bacterium]|nr:MAG: hypothetical protein EOO31_09825 [Comamonadaceae bacterium]